MNNKEWHYKAGDQSFLVSTVPDLISDKCINDFLAHPAMYWASSMGAQELITMRQNSVILGLYLNRSSTDASSDLETIGMARLVTDQATIIYLTDVYVVAEHQGKGLGKWLIQCVADLAKSMPHLRRITLMAANQSHAIGFYNKLLGAKVFDQVGGKVVFMSSKMEGLDT